MFPRIRRELLFPKSDKSNRVRMKLMLRLKVTAIAIVVWSMTAIAHPLTFAQAKLQADKSEGDLKTDDMQLLIKTQGQFAGTTFANCINRTSSPPSNFTVVVELGKDGHVINSWLRGESSFALCFRDRMVSEFSFQPPSIPFFTSFDYTNKP